MTDIRPITSEAFAAIEATGNTVIITVDDPAPAAPEPGHSPDYLRGWHDCYARVLEMLMSVGFTPR